ncbi:putative cadmium-transporting ATPase [Luteitalea pratensis]|uniref:Putative cadmium-transporting ATPase n=1 Tax=Luteitalea pratensis TaxID=1855912 RepID=A0A143PHD7_LUTPR|nr:heavy metal translocating P-type ATPase [Luteitalea pratensis]AMY08002.1 putative cadmium-transporting ATPase [Luteitalea pratensis]
MPGARPAVSGPFRTDVQLALSLACGALLLVAWIGESWFGLTHLAAVVLYVLSGACGAWDLVRASVADIRAGRWRADIDLLMLLAAVGAAALGEWVEGTFLLFLFSLANAAEHYAMGRATGAIRALGDLTPPTARLVYPDGRDEVVPIAQVMRGALVLVRPAERIPVDGVVRSGRSAVDQAPITGESVPVDKAPGDQVFAGTVNGGGALQVETTGAAGERTLDRIIKLVADAQASKAHTEQLTASFERIFVPMVLVGAAVLIAVPPLLGVWPWATSIYRGMALLVAASPCALALGTPAAILSGIAQAARHGVLVKGGSQLEALGTVRALAVDKTGTLTIGRPDVTDVVPLDGTAADMLAVAAAVERQSQHPLAEAIVRRADAEAVPALDAGPLESVTARGVRSIVGGETVEIGSIRMWDDLAGGVPTIVQDAVAALQAQARSTMVVRHGRRWLGVFGVADTPRAAAPSALATLRRLGVKPIVMLTGDNERVGVAIGRQVGVDEVRAGLLPEDKARAIEQLRQQYGSIAMIGDGVNDAPALALASVGIAMGAAGTAAALEAADVALMGDDIAQVPFAIGLARQARRIIVQNLTIALAVIAVLIVATTTGTIGIGPAVVLHEGSTLVVIANALRLLGYRLVSGASLASAVPLGAART